MSNFNGQVAIVTGAASGLGLAICRSIVDANKGSIRAEDNHPQPGTTIVIELPTAGENVDTLQPVAVLKENYPDSSTTRSDP